MQVIDLLMKIHKKAEVPRNIIINSMRYVYDDSYKGYVDEKGNVMIIDSTNNVLNMPVGIIKDKIIDIDRLEEININTRFTDYSTEITYLKIKYNELIKAVKQLNEKFK
jgi:hypothetical protein